MHPHAPTKDNLSLPCFRFPCSFETPTLEGSIVTLDSVAGRNGRCVSRSRCQPGYPVPSGGRLSFEAGLSTEPLMALAVEVVGGEGVAKRADRVAFVVRLNVRKAELHSLT
jgi:hypothetical protein